MYRSCLQLCFVLLCVGIVMAGGRQASPPSLLRIYRPPLILRLRPLCFYLSDSAPSLLPLPSHCRYEGIEGVGGGGHSYIIFEPLPDGQLTQITSYSTATHTRTGTRFLISKFLITKFLTHKVPNPDFPNHKIPKLQNF